VQWKRVDGDLAVSRALGDFQYKNRPDLPADKQKVSCLPEIRVWERKLTDEVLLLACDGLWDVMSNDEAIEEVRSIFQSGERNAMLVAEEMIDVALEKGSLPTFFSFIRFLVPIDRSSHPTPLSSILQARATT
jgi:protein phosphatase 1B